MQIPQDPCILYLPTFTVNIRCSPRKNTPVSWILMGMMEIPQGFTRIRRGAAVVGDPAWTPTRVTVDFRNLSVCQGGVCIVYYTYVYIPVGDCILSIYIYTVGFEFILFYFTVSLIYRCLRQKKQQQRLMSNVTLPSRCTSADGSGIASGVVLMPKDSKKLSGGPTAISLGKAHLKITPRFFKGKSSSTHLHDLGFLPC